MSTAFTHDLIVIGAGPAGMSATINAQALGLKTLVLDEQPRPGGQIYRNITAVRPSVSGLLGPDYRYGQDLALRFCAADADVRPGTLVWDIAQDLTVSAQQNGKSFQVRAPQLLVATGAMERPSPIHGWTLPGVLNAGAAQIALKTAAQVPSGRVVLVGGGPLLLLVACQLLQAGASVAAVVNTSPSDNRWRALRHLPAALGQPGMLLKGLRMLRQLRCAGVPIYDDATDVKIEGSTRVESVSFTAASTAHHLGADVALLHHGVVPNTQVTRLLRVAHDWNDAQLAWHPRADRWGQTSLPGLRIAGDGAAISGALSAEASGALAALGAAAALGRIDDKTSNRLAAPWKSRLAKQNRIRPFLDALYRPPRWLAADCPDDTVVCRCEEVTAGRVREMARLGCKGPNQTKFFSRCGMGPCQGRMCGLTVTQVLADALHQSPAEVGAYRIRAPLKPISLGSMAAMAAPPPEPMAQKSTAPADSVATH